MCYDYIEFHPGDKFNVILGPNGSGKSTFVSAITIGLGGDIKDLKRQNNLGDFVKNTTDKDDKAEICIKLHKGELDHEDRPLLDKVECHFKKVSQKPDFYKNGKRVDKLAIVQLAEQYQIQTSNLCQFLPQEVVREFPQMKPEMIFHNTLRAMGNEDMLKMHDDLSKKQANKKKFENHLETKKNTLLTITNELEGYDDLREREAKRKRIEDNIVLLKKRILYLEIKDILRKKDNLVDLIKKAKENKVKAEEKQAKLKSKNDEYEKKKSKLDKENVALSRKIGDFERTMNNSEPMKIEKEIEDIENDLKRLNRDETNAVKEKKRLEKQLKEKLKEIENCNPDSIQKEFDEWEKKKNSAEIKMNEMEELEKNTNSKIGQLRHKISLKQRDIEDKKSADKIRLTYLQRKNPDAYKGVEWLRSNQQMFNKQIHEPIMMVLKVKEKGLVVQLEDVIGHQEMETFVCEDKDDANKLMNILRREQKLRKINVVHSDPNLEHLDLRNPPISGRATFLDKIIVDCPKSVMKHLCMKKHLHKIPVFIDDPPQDYGLVKYYVGKKRVTIIASKYSKNKSKSIDSSLEARNPQYIPVDASSDDTQEIDSIRDEIKGYEMEIKELQKLIEGYNKAKNEANGKKTEALLMRDQVMKKRSTLVRLKDELKGIETKIENQKRCGNVEELKAEKFKERIQLVNRLADANRNLVQQIRVAGENKIKHDINELLLQQLLDQTESDRKKFDEAVAEFEKYSDEVKDQEKKLEDLTTKLIKCKADSQAWLKFPVINGVTTMEMPPELKQEMDDVCPKSLKECNVKLLSFDSDLKIIPKVRQEDLIQMQRKEKEKERVESEVKKISKEVETLTRELRNNEDTLVNGIHDMITDINERFRDLMERMGFAGEVTLKKGNHDLDFQNYGLEILVKFRESEKLQKFSGTAQSGGEKSVTTALYMMALQGNTQVPFRVVDEINQGMDETNEKRVWNLLVEQANQHSSQFFYLAPKYPASLEFEGKMHIHICCNGKVSSDRNKNINVAEILKEAKRRQNL